MSNEEMLVSQITRLESRLENVQSDLSLTTALYEAGQRRFEKQDIQFQKLREALSLAKSMVLCGEKMSPRAEAQINEALSEHYQSEL